MLARSRLLPRCRFTALALGLLALGGPGLLHAEEVDVSKEESSLGTKAPLVTQGVSGLQELQGFIEAPEASSPIELLPAHTPQPAAARAATSSSPPAPASEPISLQVGTRLALRAQNPNAPREINDASSQGAALAVLSGQVHPFLKWQVGFLGSYGVTNAAPPTNGAALLDLVAKIEIAPALNLWIGRMPIPANRSSLSTEWGILPWTLPGNYGFFPYPLRVGVRSGENGRGDGLTLWGDLGRGRFKYYLGAFDLDRPKDTSPLLTGRLSLCLLDPEPGYRTSGAYEGKKRILSLSLGAQHQTNGSHALTAALPLASNFTALTTDLLFEIGNASAGVLDVEGGFARVWGDFEPADYHVSALISYLLPVDIGAGRFQPLVRLQRAGRVPGSGSETFTSVDAQLGYLVDGSSARLLVIYEYADLPGQAQNALLFGLQLLSRAK